MPAVSRNQQIAMAIALHNPKKLKPENRGLLKMSKDQLRDFAATPRTGLPKKAPKKQDGGLRSLSVMATR